MLHVYPKMVHNPSYRNCDLPIGKDGLGKRQYADTNGSAGSQISPGYEIGYEDETAGLGYEGDSLNCMHGSQSRVLGVRDCNEVSLVYSSIATQVAE